MKNLKEEKTIKNKKSDVIKKTKIPMEEYYKKIHEVAYGLYTKRGCLEGNEQSDWLEAEKFVSSRFEVIR